MIEPKVIVVGNEKGGSGKSTLSINVAVAYLYKGFKVATIDLDGRQGTITHYIENRVKFSNANDLNLPFPEHLVITPSQYMNHRTSWQDEAQLDNEIKELKRSYDIIVIDTPGTFHHLSNAGHKNADILLTPVNDSLIDIDVIANIDPETKELIGEAQYTKNIRDIQEKQRILNKPPLKWIVLRNRTSQINAKNKQEVDNILNSLQYKLGFTYMQGFAERVVYREMFLKGLTIYDLLYLKSKDLTNSHITAEKELNQILSAIGI